MAVPYEAVTRVSSNLDYYDLGSYHRTVDAANEDARVWSNRGFIWSYAFNHDEAVYCFEQAIAHDPSCAIAWWGIGYSLGPNYNKPWEAFEGEEFKTSTKRMRHAADQAEAYIHNVNLVDRLIIRALRYRCPPDGASPEFSIWNSQYAQAMSEAYQEMPGNSDVAALYADALMNLTPWQMWDLSTGQPAKGAYTLEAKTILENALTGPGGPEHPGLLHLYIHLMEMSPEPEAAMSIANRLRMLVPDAGHLNHMPTHLDILCGDYQQAIMSNSDAIRADEKFFARSDSSRKALDAATQLEASIPETLLRIESPPMADWLEGFLSTRVHILVRFGRWQELLDMEYPHDVHLWCVTTTMIHYGKGIAWASLGKISEAEEQRKLFQDALKRVPSSRTLFNNKCINILAVASAMLDGEIEYRRGNYDAGLDLLLGAISLDDTLPYDEPWGWMQPTRHAYGALLLEQGFVDKAAGIYRADLGIDKTLPRAQQHPNNVWALKGYHECLVKLESPEAAAIKAQLDIAAAKADVPITSSCFCRLGMTGDTSFKIVPPAKNAPNP